MFYDFLTLLHTHSLDFHASLRLLCTFQPSKSVDNNYTRLQAASMVANATDNLPGDAVDPAVQEVQHWLDLYAQRVLDSDEVSAWSEGVEEGEWESARRRAMEGVNPRFVLRQWVLEELIADMEKAGTENIQEARVKLARVLDVSGIVSPNACPPLTSRWRPTPSGRTTRRLKRAGSGLVCVNSEARRCSASSVAVAVRNEKLDLYCAHICEGYA